MREKKKLSRILYLWLVLIMTIVPACVVRKAEAAILTQRSLSLSTPIAGATSNHTFRFNITSPGSLGSIQFEYCDNTPFVGTFCAVPPGLSVNTAAISSQTGETGFSIGPGSTANNLILTRTPSASLAGPLEYVFTGATNPSTPNNSTYVRISTYASDDATGPLSDQGGLVFSTAGLFGTAAYVPPQLYFCAGITVSPDCSSFSGDNINFGTMSFTTPSYATSQFAAATNDPTGYVIYSLGTTMMSGNNVIPASSTPNPSVAGLSQFGLNLRDNNNPDAGVDVTGPGTGSIMPEYATANLYKFSAGAALAQAIQATDYNVYTATYITNVSLDQPAGIYVTTITYMAVAQF